MTDIYSVSLNNQLNVKSDSHEYYIVRVPGGWIYTIYPIGVNSAATSVFVPYNLEFGVDWLTQLQDWKTSVLQEVEPPSLVAQFEQEFDDIIANIV